MNVSKKENYTLVAIEDTFDDFKDQLNSLASDHLVIEVSENLNMDDTIISLFLDITAKAKQNGMSFVVIRSGIDIDDFPENLNIVPTLQEAEDVLEMEAIERDLGF